MNYPSRTPSPLLSKLLLVFIFSQPVHAQTISDTTKAVNAHGDNGYWQSNQPDIMILWPGDDRNTVNRFTGGKDHPYPYRLWLDPDRSGGFPVLLKDETSFNNFLEHIKQNDDKDWCQLAESWSAWSGNAPSACGTHNYTEQRTCSVASDAQKPCSDLCKPAVETRTRQVDNGACQPSTPPPTGCSISPWTPARSSVCSGTGFTQSRTRADCSTEQRNNTGTKSCPQTCSITSWSPAGNSVCSGTSFTQSRTRADCSTEQRSATGTKSCPSTCTATSWAPSSSTVCSGNSLTQTRTLSNCNTDSRTVSGTKSCPPTCTATSWAPSSSTVCSGNSLTQTRTLSNCSTASRTVSGTKSCPPTCTATSWSPSSSTVCSDSTLTQTRTLSNCSTASRTVSGTKSCPPTCTATSWSPSSSTVCSGNSLTQTRTLSNCSTASRTVSGTKSCLTCNPPMQKLGNQCCAQWHNGNSIGCFSLN